MVSTKFMLALCALFSNQKIFVSKPTDVDEAYIYLQFSDSGVAQSTANSWPTKWRPLSINFINGTAVFEANLTSLQQESAFVFYKVRYIYRNRSYHETNLIPMVWNIDRLHSYYLSTIALIILGVTLLLISIVVLGYFNCNSLHSVHI